MQQPFNPKRVLRQISNPYIKEYFERLGHPLEIDWDSISNTQVDSIFDAWQGLAGGPRKTAEILFQNVHDMSNENGIRVIIEDAHNHGEDLAPRLESMESRYDKAIWTAMNRANIWDAAVRFAKADTLSSGRSWVKRGNLPVVALKPCEAGVSGLQDAMSAFFCDRQGRGHYCKVEHFPRGNDLDYYFVYLSDYADTHINFDGCGSIPAI
ncbi:MAG: hypothetical protein HKP58_06875 [Desulfatitalea sp.]|nr:hypothetical protein [Desulfatitalea sp.]NNK00119.1 hypothetical protein [Desulfatitalea sp.]